MSVKGKRIGFVGCGNMGEALVKGLVEAHVVPAEAMTASDARGERLTELERRFLSATIQSPFSFHDVIEVEAGRRLVLRDVFLGTEVNVTEWMGSQHVRVGDIVFGKVIQIDHVGMLCGMGWMAIPPVQKQMFRAAMAAMRNLEVEVFGTHLRHCVSDALQSRDSKEANQKIEELTELLVRRTQL